MAAEDEKSDDDRARPLEITAIRLRGGISENLRLPQGVRERVRE